MYKAFADGPIGVKAGFEEALGFAYRYGFEGITLQSDWVRQAGPEAARAKLADHGLKAAGWGLPVPFSTEDRELFERSLQELSATAAEFAEVGCDRCSTYIFPFSDERPFEEQFAFLRDRFARIGEILAKAEVRLGLEFLGPKTLRDGHKYEFIYTMDGMLELCRAVGTGNMGLLLDSWHLYTSGGSMSDVLKLCDHDVVLVHVNDAPRGIPHDQQVDNVRTLPGETGVIGVDRFLHNLQQIAYNGPVVVEPFCERINQLDDEEAVRLTQEALDSVWPA